jgi:competence ComEA-like helix-hairpin-helix protein
MLLEFEAKKQAAEHHMGGLCQDMDASRAAMLGNALAVGMTPLSVNINPAIADEMADGLLGLGPVSAPAIVAYLGRHGSFEEPLHLVAMTGIGEATLAKNLPMIVVE